MAGIFSLKDFSASQASLVTMPGVENSLWRGEKTVKGPGEKKTILWEVEQTMKPTSPKKLKSIFFQNNRRRRETSKHRLQRELFAEFFPIFRFTVAKRKTNIILSCRKSLPVRLWKKTSLDWCRRRYCGLLSSPQPRPQKECPKCFKAINLEVQYFSRYFSVWFIQEMP